MKFISLCFVLLIAQVSAWNSETHLLIARMAYDILKKTNPTVLQKAESLLREYSDRFTQEHEKDYPFVECVTLPDDNKRAGGGWQSNWHFNDMPFIGDSSKASDLNIKYDAKNISMAMPAIYTWLSGGDAKDTVAYQTVMKHVKSENEGKSLALRLLIHYYGDIHQPLHNVDRYTKKYSSGDKGGNMFPLKNHYNANELHALWDNVIYTYHKNPKRPFNKDSWADQGAMAADLVGQYTFSKSETDTLDFKKFSEESYKIAVTVYDGVKEGEPVPDSYVSKFAPIAKRRVVLSAHRLVYAMEQLFGKSRRVVQEVPYQTALNMIEKAQLQREEF